MHEDQPRSDEQLVRAINRGDVDAFAELYRRHRDWVVSLAWRFTDDRELALDVMQEVFAHLLTRFPGFRLTAKMRTYLYPVVRSVAATHLRRRRGHAGESALLALPSRASGGPPETLEVLHTAIASLPDGQREVLLMRIVDGMATAEIAAALGIPPGTVKSRLHHALKGLRADDRLRAYFEDEL